MSSRSEVQSNKWIGIALLSTVLSLTISQLIRIKVQQSSIEDAVTRGKARSLCFQAHFTYNCAMIPDNQAKYDWCTDISTETPRFIGGNNYDGIPRKSTTVKAYRTFKGFQHCMAHKHVILIGDSRVRYQYMSLVDYLMTAEWLHCQDYNVATRMNETVSPHCFIIHHDRKYGKRMTWNDWYALSSALLHDVCDCHRDTKFDPVSTYENRYARIRSPFGPISITYLQNFQNSVKFHAEFPPFASLTGNCTASHCQPGLCNQPTRLELNTSETLLKIVPKLRPTHVFAQTGWDHYMGDTPATFGCLLERFKQENPGVHAFAISHYWERDAKRVTRVPQHGCNASVFDRLAPSYRTPKSWYWDNKHVLSILNQEMNHQLLDHICGPLNDTSVCI